MIFIQYTSSSLALNADKILSVRSLQRHYDSNSKQIGYCFYINMSNSKNDEFVTTFLLKDYKNKTMEELFDIAEHDRQEYIKFIASKSEPGVYIFRNKKK